MSTVTLIEYEDASEEVRVVYDEIMAARGVDWVNNFWKAMAVHPPTLRRTWDSVRTILSAGALDPVVKEMIFVAVSTTNGCPYCIHSHTAAARAKGMTDEMYGELLAVIGLANTTNALVTAMQVPVDPAFDVAASS